MRFIKTDLSPANKKQYLMAMGKKDIELLHEVALMAHKYTPNTKELHDAKRRLASIGKAFASAMAEVEYDSDEGDKLPIEERQHYKDELDKNPLYEINRFELIDARPCSRCQGTGRIGTETDSAAGVTISFPKECPICQGLGSEGRKVIFWDNNTQVTSSIQDQGRTMKLFIDPRDEPINAVPPRLVDLLNEDGDVVTKIIELLDSTSKHKNKQ